MEYKILTSENSNQLTEELNTYSKNNWKLIGNIRHSFAISKADSGKEIVKNKYIATIEKKSRKKEKNEI